MALVVLGTSALFLFLAIASYSPDDPSFNFTGTGDEVRNLVGASGAFFADLALLIFGWTAYSIPLLLTLFGIRLLQRDRSPWSLILWCVRASGWLGVCGDVSFFTLEDGILVAEGLLWRASLPAWHPCPRSDAGCVRQPPRAKWG